jgi:hypothetical protein
MFGGGFRAADSVTVGGDRVVQPAWLFWVPLLALGLLIFWVVREVRNHRRRAYMRYPVPPRP